MKTNIIFRQCAGFFCCFIYIEKILIVLCKDEVYVSGIWRTNFTYCSWAHSQSITVRNCSKNESENKRNATWKSFEYAYVFSRDHVTQSVNPSARIRTFLDIIYSDYNNVYLFLPNMKELNSKP